MRKRSFIFIVSLLVSGLAYGDEPLLALQPSLAAAKDAIQAAETYANKAGLCIGVVVVDRSGAIIAGEKQDCAIPMNMEYAKMKAATSGALGVTTRALRADAQPGKPLYGIETSYVAGTKVTLLDGGVPIVFRNQLVGGIGVGSTVLKREANQQNATDQDIAQVAVNAFVNSYVVSTGAPIRLA